MSLIVGILTNYSDNRVAKNFISILREQQSRMRASGKKGYCCVKNMWSSKKIYARHLQQDVLCSFLLEIPEDAAYMADVDRSCCQNTEMVFMIRCNDYVPLRDLECHMDK